MAEPNLFQINLTNTKWEHFIGVFFFNRYNYNYELRGVKSHLYMNWSLYNQDFKCYITNINDGYENIYFTNGPDYKNGYTFGWGIYVKDIV